MTLPFDLDITDDLELDLDPPGRPRSMSVTNIMRSTCELLTSDFVELEMTFLTCVQKAPPTA